MERRALIDYIFSGVKNADPELKDAITRAVWGGASIVRETTDYSHIIKIISGKKEFHIIKDSAETILITNFRGRVDIYMWFANPITLKPKSEG